MDEKSQHVVKGDGGWAVRKAGNQRATRIFDSQEDAIDWARRAAQAQQGELYIHRGDGRILEKRSYSTSDKTQERRKCSPLKEVKPKG
ncbi:DUF2188 domain-containing protein [Pseudoalteromonas sp. T1lg122]|uniref:DUF2188 domain-containing protein n=1 Tax=Pseudoalteromonas sp. T1lg122 TaxID=2077094 RepID=UPI000CF65D2C|nr:DUF2188 domain-containing protein [Pseudoalteromonas sp. T1lg122]